jgi:transposase
MTMTTAPAVLDGQDGVVVDHDPAARPRRRRFTAAYKAEILDRYDALPKGSPERGALLRREGLYSSHIAEWRKQRAAGVEVGLGPRSSAGHRVKTPEQRELEALRRRNTALESELNKTRLALEITGKAHALLELLSESAERDPQSRK